MTTVKGIVTKGGRQPPFSVSPGENEHTHPKHTCCSHHMTLTITSELYYCSATVLMSVHFSQPINKHYQFHNLFV